MRDLKRAELVATILNQDLSGPDTQDYYKVVPEDYKLERFQP